MPLEVEIPDVLRSPAQSAGTWLVVHMENETTHQWSPTVTDVATLLLSDTYFRERGTMDQPEATNYLANIPVTVAELQYGAALLAYENKPQEPVDPKDTSGTMVRFFHNVAVAAAKADLDPFGTDDNANARVHSVPLIAKTLHMMSRVNFTDSDDPIIRSARAQDMLDVVRGELMEFQSHQTLDASHIGSVIPDNVFLANVILHESEKKYIRLLSSRQSPMPGSVMGGQPYEAREQFAFTQMMTYLRSQGNESDAQSRAVALTLTYYTFKEGWKIGSELGINPTELAVSGKKYAQEFLDTNTNFIKSFVDTE